MQSELNRSFSFESCLCYAFADPVKTFGFSSFSICFRVVRKPLTPRQLWDHEFGGSKYFKKLQKPYLWRNLRDNEQCGGDDRWMNRSAFRNFSPSIVVHVWRLQKRNPHGFLNCVNLDWNSRLQSLPNHVFRPQNRIISEIRVLNLCQTST